MPLSVRVDPVRSLAVLRGTGVLTAADLLRASNELTSHPAFGAGLRQLIVLEITSSTIVFGDVIAYRKHRAKAVHSQRIALVAASDLAYGVARQYATAYQQPDQEIRVLRDLAPACEWLDVTVPDVAAVEALPPRVP
ncbi:MAG TPA: hypothetical protein VF678_01585 [bacterium]